VAVVEMSTKREAQSARPDFPAILVASSYLRLIRSPLGWSPAVFRPGQWMPATFVLILPLLHSRKPDAACLPWGLSAGQRDGDHRERVRVGGAMVSNDVFHPGFSCATGAGGKNRDGDVGATL